MTEVMVILSTAPSRDAGIELGRRLVGEGLAACVNVLPGAHSVYRWQGAVEEAEEAVLLIKTRQERYAALERRLRELHVYAVPEIIAVPVAAGSPLYLEWVEATVPGGGDVVP